MSHVVLLFRLQVEVKKRELLKDYWWLRFLFEKVCKLLRIKQIYCPQFRMGNFLNLSLSELMVMNMQKNIRKRSQCLNTCIPFLKLTSIIYIFR